MRIEYNHNNTFAKIYGDYSYHCVVVKTEVVEYFGDMETTFHQIKEWQNKNLMPRLGSESRPLSMRDINCSLDNESRNERYWQWKQFTGVREQTGYDYVYGYGHYDFDGSFVIVDKEDKVLFRV